MRHATDGSLRRLEDEPFAVPDRTIDHLEHCPRCRARLSEIASDSERCARILTTRTAPFVPDIDAAWVRFRRESAWLDEGRKDSSHSPVKVPRHSPRLFNISVRSGILVGAAGLVLAGTAAAATITTVFAPTHVAPLPLDKGDLHALANFMGLGDSGVPGGFQTSSGSQTTGFGTIEWSSSGSVQTVGSLAEASRDAGFAVKLPSQLPAGVGSSQQFVVQPAVKVTATFDPSDAGVGGSSVVLNAGPAVLVEYGSSTGIASITGSAPGIGSSFKASKGSAATTSNGSASTNGPTTGNSLGGFPTLGILTMPRPTAVSSGATTSEIESYLLAQPGVPSELAEEIRLLGDVGTTLPIPVPPGASVRSVQISGSPGVLVADASNAVAGVVWENGSGMLHVVAGLLDQQDILNVAEQLG